MKELRSDHRAASARAGTADLLPYAYSAVAEFFMFFTGGQLSSIRDFAPFESSPGATALTPKGQE